MCLPGASPQQDYAAPQHRKEGPCEMSWGQEIISLLHKARHEGVLCYHCSEERFTSPRLRAHVDACVSCMRSCVTCLFSQGEVPKPVHGD